MRLLTLAAGTAAVFLPKALRKLQTHRGRCRLRGGRTLSGKLLRPETSITTPHFEKSVAFQVEMGDVGNVEICGGISALAADYDAFTIDSCCLQDPSAGKHLASAFAAGKKCVVMSSSAERAAVQLDQLREMGVDPAHVAGVVTSGELAHDYLRRTGSKLGNRVLWIGSQGSPEQRAASSLFEGLIDYSFSDDAVEADFLLASGVESLFAGTPAERRTGFMNHGSPRPFGPVFTRAIARSLPMLCVSPNLHTLKDTSWSSPSTLAMHYEKLGGRVLYFGKPQTAAFNEAIAILEEAGVSSDRICHVGASPKHDVGGAAAVGLDVIFVAGAEGDASTTPEEAEPELPLAEGIAAVCLKAGVPLPRAAVPRFAW